MGGSASESWAEPFLATASEKDVLDCFRLLYGREPRKDEWRAGFRAIGGSLHDLVASYLRSPEFAHRGLLGKHSCDDVRLVEHAGFRIFAAADDADVGKHVLVGCYEPEVTAVFRRVLRAGMGVIDIGANIGFFTMLSAALVGNDGYVPAVEPNPNNTKLIEASRRENGFEHVQIAQLAAAPETGSRALHWSSSTGTTSDLPGDISAVLGSTIVPGARPDALLPYGRRINLIKVDADGADYKALLGCTGTIARDRPLIIAEFAPSFLLSFSGVSGDEYLQWFIGQGYDLSIIQSDGSVTSVGGDRGLVLQELRARGTDHLDILATPA